LSLQRKLIENKIYLRETVTRLGYRHRSGKEEGRRKRHGHGVREVRLSWRSTKIKAGGHYRDWAE
jgi:hypothetical protein